MKKKETGNKKLNKNKGVCVSDFVTKVCNRKRQEKHLLMEKKKRHDLMRGDNNQ